MVATFSSLVVELENLNMVLAVLMVLGEKFKSF